MSRKTNGAYQRRLRAQAHRAFDNLWTTDGERSEAYRDLAVFLDMTTSRCHFGSLNPSQCRRAMIWIKGRARRGPVPVASSP